MKEILELCLLRGYGLYIENNGIFDNFEVALTLTVDGQIKKVHTQSIRWDHLSDAYVLEIIRYLLDKS